MSWFYHNLAHNPSAITQDAIDEYVSHYSAPGGMRAGFEYYRAIPENEMQNQNYSKTNLTMPVLGLGGGYTPAFGGNITMLSIVYGLKLLAENVQSVVVPNSGHWIPEEQPRFLADTLIRFFGNIRDEICYTLCMQSNYVSVYEIHFLPFLSATLMFSSLYCSCPKIALGTGFGGITDIKTGPDGLLHYAKSNFLRNITWSA